MSCYLCDHSDFTLRKGVVRDDPTLKIIECKNCGLVTLSPMPNPIPGYYEAGKMHGEDMPSIEYWARQTYRDDQRRFEMLRPALVNRRVLDFGCGAAGFLHLAQSVATEVVGVELQRSVREHTSNANIRIAGSIGTASGVFDVITAFHVVEHLSDPLPVIRELGTHLKVGGTLIVEVPSANDALLTLYDSDAFQRFTYWSLHLFLFNPETLNHLATLAGLRAVAVKQTQRYPLSNHLRWLSHNEPGGHERWSFLDTPELSAAYAASLAAIGKCDTLIAYLES